MRSLSAIVCAAILAGVIVGCREGQRQPPPQWQAQEGYSFERGVRVGETAKRAYDDADLNRAVEAYRFFYPTVSGEALLRGMRGSGSRPFQARDGLCTSASMDQSRRRSMGAGSLGISKRWSESVDLQRSVSGFPATTEEAS